MENVEKYIQGHTRNDSNICWDASFGYIPWLTIDDAREAAKIARKETVREVCEWIKYNNENGGCLFDGWENDLNKHLDGEV